ncbi:MAG TPA: hypothetical protein VF605_19055 [Allosphingosinicella sp.]|jgi:hypothetical protein
MRVLLACFASLAAASPAAAQQAGTGTGYPSDKVLAAFATACSGVEDPAVMRASALAAGWTEIVPDPASQLGRLIAMGEAEVRKDAEIKVLRGLFLKRTVAGRSLFLVGSGIELGTLHSYGCRLYDFAAPEPIPAEALESWAVRKPNQTQAQGGVVRHVWNPGLKPGHMEMEVSFVAQDAPIRREPLFSALSGLAMTATAMESLEQ